ncbi:RICIN domain-containing protein [Actinoplanes sp. NBRC 101535]|uniref:RICIN domain-containing protein n=1 Tax=Actinoplanes sp. NBRC 101535 TaxID=3032196 RepID=UPI002554D0F8|nr:RICIN domain-containing protein [Actinoplanes sp. NBRC 101535]
MVLLGVGAVVGPHVIGTDDTDGRSTMPAVPEDVPDQGLVYSGLALAAAGTLCSGAYQLYEETCTFGPDTAPAGLAVRRDVAPVTEGIREVTTVSRESSAVPPDAEIARDLGGSALTADAPALVPDAAPGQADFILGPDAVACAGDGRSGKRVQLLYLHEAGTESRYAKFLNSFRTWAAGVDAIYDASAAETGGSRHIRYVTTPECRPDVSEIQLPAGSLDSFVATVDSLRNLGYNRTDRKYLIFSDTNVYCGISTYVADTRPTRGNRNNGGPSYARVDSGCWSSAVAAHELTHTLGATLIGSPNSTGTGSCTDEYDLLCGEDRSGRAMREECPKKHSIRLDCGHDDYFSTDPEPGSYLDKNWNVALSEFLLRSDGGDDIPDAPGATVPDAGGTTSAAPVPAPDSAASAVASPSATKSAGPLVSLPGVDISVGADLPGLDAVAFGDDDEQTLEHEDGGVIASPGVANNGVQAVLEIREATSSSVRLLWSAADKDATYQVWVDGKPVASTKSTRARLIGLKPNAKYTVEVKNKALEYAAKGVAETAPAASPVQNSWFVLSNALTGGAADLYAARTADGSPVTLADDEGGTQQQWQLAPAENGTYSLISKASGRCVVPLDGTATAGTPLVQGDCQAEAGARWTLQASDYGFTLRSATADLVVGVGAQRFGTHRVLVLQPDSGQRHQSWTAVPE